MSRVHSSSTPDRGRALRSAANALALAMLLGGGLWLALIWQAIPDALVMQMNLASPAEEGSKLSLLIFPSIALVLYLLLTHAERIGALNLPDLGSPERNVQAARQAAAVLKAISVSLIMLIQLTVLTPSPAGSPGLWLLFAGSVVGLFVIQLI